MKVIILNSLISLIYAVQKPAYEHLKAVSVRSTWLELIQSLATFNVPIQLPPKLVWMLENRKKMDEFEYDRETNRLDAVSSFK